MLRKSTAILGLFLLSGCLSPAGSSSGVPHGSLFSDTTGEKADINGKAGPRVVQGAATEVWAVERSWDEADAEAGIAWPAGSGLDWEAKFDLWIASMTTIERDGLPTFQIRTPFGDRVFEAPTLECAEVALMLRVSFASWYHLPFFMQGWDSNSRQTMYAGHFGVINKAGRAIDSFPSFRTRYSDHTNDWKPGDAWPHDAALRRQRLGDDDAVPSLAEDGSLGAGAYFDEFFLNKRVGYFARLLLLYFGSANLAESPNTFHVTAEAAQAGDMLINRYALLGIGHVLPIMRHRGEGVGNRELWIASGSMPRAQPYWEEPGTAKSSFFYEAAGGPGHGEFGGGVRRWRTAVARDGRWRNIVREADVPYFIDQGDFPRIEARTTTFATLLKRGTDEQELQIALQQVEVARQHLRNHPSSCAARTRREAAFQRAYEYAEGAYGDTPAVVDGMYRTAEDYLFSELDPAASKTCCWNSSTYAMTEILVDYANQELAAAAARGECIAPTVFRWEETGYERWANHAAAMGRASEWESWSASPGSCSQRDVNQDSLAPATATPFCDRPVQPTDGMPPQDSECDSWGPDDSIADAILFDGTFEGKICGVDDDDHYLIEGGGGVRVTFDNADGTDIDIEAYLPDGTFVDSSATFEPTETVSHPETFVVRVFAYEGAAAYTITRL